MSLLTWLADAHDRSKRTLPRRPLRADLREYARVLAIARSKVAPDDPRMQVDDAAPIVRHVIESEELICAHRIAWRDWVIVALGVLLFLETLVLFALLVRP